MNELTASDSSEAAARLPADAAARAQALDPRRSFIVQAPAGSGKTELLIRRVLALLAIVDAPEEVIALTFTRKAAGEMRARVMTALHRAQDPSPPPEGHARETWQLARAALVRDATMGWALAVSPGRLRIQTLDGLCASLVRRMPLLSRLGGMPRLDDDASRLYREAARETIALLEAGTPAQSQAVATLLLHLDNRSGAVESLLAQMLARRDQWLRHVWNHDPATDRALLEGALREVRREAFAQVAALLGPHAAELSRVAAWAAANLDESADSPLLACRDLAGVPGADETDAAAWLGLAELALTAQGQFRRAVNKNHGFPPGAKGAAAKEAFLALLEDCGRVDGLCDALAALRHLPPARYDDAQWEVLGAVVEVLRLAAAQLELVFAAHGACDFAAVSQAALQALGTPDAPTDLLLSLDARIRHLLIDEFQDTSITQFDLLERLTAGWQDGDGRTLFLVGDPMQSIYRFREAEVGLFLRAWQAGVGALRLQPLRLSTNFRSAQGVVDWVNAAFTRVLPPRADIARGAVSYEPATHWHPALPGEAVSVHAFVDGDAVAEASRVSEIVRSARAADPAASVAVLVRGRAHLAEIVPALRALGTPLRAVEIETLRERPVVQDLLALTRALLHPADRIAWLAVLRAPWCGLLLADLHALAVDAPRRPLWLLMNDDARAAALSDDGRARLAAVTTALAPALEDARRGSLRDAVEGAWLRLGGADCLRAARDGADARAYLDLLAQVETAADIDDLTELDARMDRLFAAPDPHDPALPPPVELMTIHKAKGLEFDVVIVPGLHRRPRGGEASLLAWSERSRPDSDPALLLGVVAAADGVADGVHAWIARLERERERLESARLLYVAATRARQRLHLLGSVASFDGKAGRSLRTPVQDALLAPLWPVVQPSFEAALAAVSRVGEVTAGGSAPAAPAADLDPRTWRLVAPMPLRADDLPLDAPTWHALAPVIGDRRLPQFSWAGETVRLVGTVVHRWLQRIAEAPQRWDAARVDAIAVPVERELSALGLPPAERAAAVQRVLSALRATLADVRGQWLLMARAPEAQAASELKLTGIDRGERVNVAIDRCFVDAGVRWVIDYKTGSHEGAGVEAFLDREVERYREQLSRYARLLRATGPEPVRCGLYFPLLSAWREWEA